MKQSTHPVTPIVDRPVEIQPAAEDCVTNDVDGRPRQARTQWLWLMWERRQFLRRVAIWGLVLSTIIVFLIPKRYESTTRLMPPDSQSSSGLAMLAAIVGKVSPGMTAMAGDLLGMKNTGALFAEILQSRTVEDHLVDRFNLRKV